MPLLACNIDQPVLGPAGLSPDHRLPRLHRRDGQADQAQAEQPLPHQALLHREVGGGEASCRPPDIQECECELLL